MRVPVTDKIVFVTSGLTKFCLCCFGRNSVVSLPFLDLWGEVLVELSQCTVRTLRSGRQSQTLSPSHAFPGSCMDHCHLNAMFSVFKYQ